MSNIIDINRFEMTPSLAGWALNYLLHHKGTKPSVILDEEEIRYIGFGGREVIQSLDGKWSLRSWRRFEYRWLESRRQKAIDVRKARSEFIGAAI